MVLKMDADVLEWLAASWWVVRWCGKHAKSGFKRQGKERHMEIISGECVRSVVAWLP